MSNATIGIKIDPTGAVQGARTVQSSFKNVGDAARTAENATLQYANTSARTVKSMSNTMNSARKSSINMGMAVQQAGYQVGDFAVQVASGQGVLRPFIQQGTQLVSMFGPMGAVIGAAGAIVGAVATAFINMGDDAEDAADTAAEAMRKLERETRKTRDAAYEMANAYEKALIKAGEFAQSEGERLGKSAAAALEYATSVEQIYEQYRALDDAQNLAKNGTLGFAAVVEGVTNAKDKHLAVIQREIDNNKSLYDALKISEREYEVTQEKLRILAADGFAGTKVEARGLAEQLVDGERAMTAFRDAASEAERSQKQFARELKRTQDNFAGLLTSTKEDIEWRQIEIETLGMTASAREVYLLGRKLELEAARAGVELAPETIARYQAETAAVLSVADAFTEAEAREKDLRDTGKSFASSFINDMRSGANAAEALGGVLDKLADKLIDLALTAAFDSEGGSGLISGISAALGSTSANGNVFSGGNVVQAFANGGIVNGPTTFPMNDNQFGLMGEAGPEAIMPLSRGSNGRLGVEVSGGQQKPVVVAPVVNIQNNSNSEVSTESGTTSGGQPYTNIIVQTMQNATNKGQMDGVNAARTGARPKAIGR
ncbi:MAG: phage tail length tape measure family protein [Parvibaculaceae bacterium]|nr:phage tail length tape measure family protein [Parvibaculaceae bacterium]